MTEKSDKRTPNEKVREFYETFGKSHLIKDTPSLDPDDFSDDQLKLCVGLIVEECIELIDAAYNTNAAQRLEDAWQSVFEDGLEKDMKRDLVEAADAIADIEYVLHNFALEAGIPIDEIFDEVHASNMSKLGEDGNAILGDGVTAPLNKILKGPNYFPPAIAKIIEKHQKGE